MSYNSYFTLWFFSHQTPLRLRPKMTFAQFRHSIPGWFFCLWLIISAVIDQDRTYPSSPLSIVQNTEDHDLNPFVTPTRHQNPLAWSVRSPPAGITFPFFYISWSFFVVVDLTVDRGIFHFFLDNFSFLLALPTLIIELDDDDLAPGKTSLFVLIFSSCLASPSPLSAVAPILIELDESNILYFDLLLCPFCFRFKW